MINHRLDEWPAPVRVSASSWPSPPQTCARTRQTQSCRPTPSFLSPSASRRRTSRRRWLSDGICVATSGLAITPASTDRRTSALRDRLDRADQVRRRLLHEPAAPASSASIMSARAGEAVQSKIPAPGSCAGSPWRSRSRSRGASDIEERDLGLLRLDQVERFGAVALGDHVDAVASKTAQTAARTAGWPSATRKADGLGHERFASRLVTELFRLRRTFSSPKRAGRAARVVSFWRSKSTRRPAGGRRHRRREPPGLCRWAWRRNPTCRASALRPVLAHLRGETEARRGPA